MHFSALTHRERAVELRKVIDTGSKTGYSGDDSIRAPPLPIPNREVKPYHADGTAKAGE